MGHNADQQIEAAELKAEGNACASLLPGSKLPGRKCGHGGDSSMPFEGIPNMNSPEIEMRTQQEMMFLLSHAETCKNHPDFDGFRLFSETSPNNLSPRPARLVGLRGSRVMIRAVAQVAFRWSPWIRAQREMFIAGSMN